MPNSLPSSSASSPARWSVPCSSGSIATFTATSADLLNAQVTRVTSSPVALDLSRQGPHWPRAPRRYAPYALDHSLSMRKKWATEWGKQFNAFARRCTNDAERTAQTVPMISPGMEDTQPTPSSLLTDGYSERKWATAAERKMASALPAQKIRARVYAVQEEPSCTSAQPADSMAVEVLGEFDLTAEHICEIASSMNGSDTLSTLEVIARNWDFLFRKIGLTKQQICEIAKNRNGANSLEILTRYWPFLSSPTVGLNEQQIFNIVKRSHGGSALEVLVKQWDFFTSAKVGLTSQDIYAIAENMDGAVALDTLTRYWHLFDSAAIGLRKEQIVDIASTNHGANVLQVLVKHCHFFSAPKIGLTPDQIHAIAILKDGANTLDVLAKHWSSLNRRTLGLSKEQIVDLAKNISGSTTLEAIVNHWHFLRSAQVGFTQEHICQIAKIKDGAKILNTMAANWWNLRMTIGLSRDQILMIAKSTASAKKLRLLATHGLVLMRAYADLTPGDIVNIALDHRGASLLSAMVS